MICPNCGYQGYTEEQLKGSGCIEIVLWFFFFLPGLIYSIWRRTSPQMICPKCKQPGMIPENTPRGQELINKYGTFNIQQRANIKSVQQKSKIPGWIIFLIVFFSFIIIAGAIMLLTNNWLNSLSKHKNKPKHSVSIYYSKNV